MLFLVYRDIFFVLWASKYPYWLELEWHKYTINNGLICITFQVNNKIRIKEVGVMTLYAFFISHP